MVLKKIFLTGGSGTLGSELIKISKDFDVEFIAPSSKECNICNLEQVKQNILDSSCEIVVHSAALVDSRGIEDDPTLAFDINVGGTINVIKACMEYNKKLVFISTDYVFDGEKGNYHPSDFINPLSNYSKTKAAAELLVRTYKGSIVIRTSFYGHTFPYDCAFVDQWSSKDYVDVIAPKILDFVCSNRENSIVHIGNKKSTIYEIANERRESVEKIFRRDIDFVVPRDTSFVKTETD